jgi:peroxygenase
LRTTANSGIGLATYIMLWPEDGRMRKEDIRGIYDGSIFYTIAARRAKKA